MEFNTTLIKIMNPWVECFKGESQQGALSMQDRPSITPIYTPPTFEELCDSVEKVDEAYDKGPRQPLINLLKAFKAYILCNHNMIEEDIFTDGDETVIEDEEQHYLTQQTDPLKIPHHLLLGAWAACLEDIQSDYPLTSPDVLTLFGWKIKGSGLFNKFKTELHISDNNVFDDKTRLIVINKLYNDLFNHNGEDNVFDNEEIQAIFAKYNIDLKLVERELKMTMRILLKRISKDVNNLLHAIPTDEVFENKINFIDVSYYEAKKSKKSGLFASYHAENEEREFACQFLTALSHLIPTLVAEEKTTLPDEISRPKRTRMGALLYVMYTINDEYYIRSPLNSKLYEICTNFLNVADHEKIDFKTRKACFEAFKSLLSDKDLPGALEQYGRENYGDDSRLKHIDGRLHDIAEKLEEFLKIPPASNWPMTSLFSYLFGQIFKIPGYGLGVVIGDVANETENMIKPKVFASQAINNAGRVVLGTAGGAMGFLAADFICRSTLERLFAKVLEQAGFIFGSTVGGTIGFVLDLSYKGLKSLCAYLLDNLDTISDPTVLKNVNRDFLECLLTLPAEVFSFEDQEHLKELVDKNASLAMQPQAPLCDDETETYYYNGQSFSHCP